jgi:hypothetical protein
VTRSFGRRAGLAMVCIALLVGRAAQAQTEFPQTLNWGSGLIDIPAAWVAPVTGDFALNWAGRSLQTSPAIPQYHNSLGGTGALQVSLFKHAEVGMSVLSQDFEHGFYGQILLLNQEDLHGRSAAFLPSLAVGMRNIGPYSHMDRLGLGYQQTLNPFGGTAPAIAVDSLHRSFSTGNTMYGVATKSFSLSDLRASWPDIGVSLTLGYGNGLFSNHGSLPARAYAADATGGLFYGIKTDFRPSPNTLVSFMAENNAWDFNAGTYVSFRGLRAGLALTELAAGSAKPTAGDPASALYRYSKINFSLGWQSNIFALLHGNVLQNRVAALRHEREVLLADIGQHQDRIVKLQGQIRRYEAQNLLELEERRAQAQSQLQTETDALHRLEDRLRRVESATDSGPPTAPPSAASAAPVSPAPNGAPNP